MTFPAPGGLGQVSFEAIGTTASIVLVGPGRLDAAVAILRSELDATDRAASRFRPDSELCALNAGAGKPTEVSPVLFRAISEALRAARLTDGLVDPTVGQALVLAGYDRDFHQVDPDGPPLTLAARSVPGWQTVTVDPTRRSVPPPRRGDPRSGSDRQSLVCRSRRPADCHCNRNRCFGEPRWGYCPRRSGAGGGLEHPDNPRRRRHATRPGRRGQWCISTMVGWATSEHLGSALDARRDTHAPP